MLRSVKSKKIHIDKKIKRVAYKYGKNKINGEFGEDYKVMIQILIFDANYKKFSSPKKINTFTPIQIFPAQQRSSSRRACSASWRTCETLRSRASLACCRPTCASTRWRGSTRRWSRRSWPRASCSGTSRSICRWGTGPGGSCTPRWSRCCRWHGRRRRSRRGRKSSRSWRYNETVGLAELLWVV